MGDKIKKEERKARVCFWLVFHQYNKSEVLFSLFEKDGPEGSYDVIFFLD